MVRQQPNKHRYVLPNCVHSPAACFGPALAGCMFRPGTRWLYVSARHSLAACFGPALAGCVFGPGTRWLYGFPLALADCWFGLASLCRWWCCARRRAVGGRQPYTPIRPRQRHHAVIFLEQNDVTSTPTPPSCDHTSSQPWHVSYATGIATRQRQHHYGIATRHRHSIVIHSKRSPRFTDGIYLEAGLFLMTPFTEGCDGVKYQTLPPGRSNMLYLSF